SYRKLISYFREMNYPRYLLFLLLLGFISCKESANEFISLNGKWQFSTTESIDWQAAEVPGTLQADLLRLGEIPEPFLKNNEDSIQWISSKDWQYKKQFTVSEEILKRTKHFLKFEGLDTYTE